MPEFQQWATQGTRWIMKEINESKCILFPGCNLDHLWQMGSRCKGDTLGHTCLPEVGIPRRQRGTHRRGPPHCQRGTSYCHYPLPETWREIIHMVSNIRGDTFQWLQDTDMRPNTTNTNKNQLLQNLHYCLQLCTLLMFVSWLFSVSFQILPTWKDAVC